MPTNVAPNSATILSIFPKSLEAKRWHSGFMTYQLPEAQKDSIILREYNPERLSRTTPAPRGLEWYKDTAQKCEVNTGYVLMRVWDSFELVRDFNSEYEVYTPYPVNALDSASSLVAEWTQNVIGSEGGHPGIIVIPGVAPTPAELRAVRDLQTRYFRELVNQAQVHYTKAEHQKITDLHRCAAIWLEAEDYPWVPKLEQVQMKNCPACQNRIRKSALRCQNCSVDLPDFYRKYGLIPTVDEDPAVRGVIDRLALVQKSKPV